MKQTFIKSLLKTIKHNEERGSLFLGAILFLLCLVGVVWIGGSRLVSLDILHHLPSFSSIQMPFTYTAPSPVPTPSSSPERIHHTTATDTLWKIAVRYYNDGYQWTRVYEANKRVIKDPNKLEKDLDLVIPE